MELKRLKRAHFGGPGEQRLIGSPLLLTAAERAELPAETMALFTAWQRLRGAVPEALAWAEGEFRVRTPVFERASFDDRIYWSVRLARGDLAECLNKPCFGADGVQPKRALPAPLDWLASLGCCTIAAEQSGTAPWGQPLKSFRERRELLAFGGDEPPQLPEGADEWVALYEADGDAIFADLATGAAYWLGFEWTGEMLTPLPVGWRAVMHFVLWRLLDGGWVKPSDLRMLAAGAQPSR